MDKSEIFLVNSRLERMFYRVIRCLSRNSVGLINRCISLLACFFCQKNYLMGNETMHFAIHSKRNRKFNEKVYAALI